MCQELLSSLSLANMRNERPTCFRQFAQPTRLVFLLARPNAGNTSPTNTTTTAITTTTSIKVTALYRPLEDTGFILPRPEAKDNSRLLSKEFFLLCDSFTRR